MHDDLMHDERAHVARLHDEVWLTSAGRPVRALACGDVREGVPQVRMIPGLGAVGYMIDLLHACGAWTRAELLDLPGFGTPVTSGHPVDMDVLTDVASGCLGGPDEPRVVLLGHSTGAQLALRAAQAAPERVAALVLVGLTFDPPVRARWARLLPRLRTYLHERPRELLYTVPDLARGGRRVAQCLASSLRDVPEERVSGLSCPVLVLRGRRDTLCPVPWARAFAAACPDGELRTLPGSHNVPYTHPGAVALQIGALAARVRA